MNNIKLKIWKIFQRKKYKHSFKENVKNLKSGSGKTFIELYITDKISTTSEKQNATYQAYLNRKTY
mgnify:CR=1 FL=1